MALFRRFSFGLLGYCSLVAYSSETGLGGSEHFLSSLTRRSRRVFSSAVVHLPLLFFVFSIVTLKHLSTGTRYINFTTNKKDLAHDEQSLSSFLNSLADTEPSILPSADCRRAVTPQPEETADSLLVDVPFNSCSHLAETQVKQAVRSLGRLGCTCYQASTCRLSTRFSSWDLDHTKVMGKLVLGAASRLDAFSAYPFST